MWHDYVAAYLSKVYSSLFWIRHNMLHVSKSCVVQPGFKLCSNMLFLHQCLIVVGFFLKDKRVTERC